MTGAGPSWSTCPSGSRRSGRALRLLVESRAPGQGLRSSYLLGASVSALMLGALTLGIVKGGDWGWTSPATIACFVAAAIFPSLFVVSSRRHRSPLVDPALLRIRPSLVGNVATIVAGVGLYRRSADDETRRQQNGVGRTRSAASGVGGVPGARVAAILAARLGPSPSHAAIARSSSPAPSSGRSPTSGTRSASR